MQEQVSALVAKAAELHDELNRERAATIAQLDRLAASSAALEGTKQQALPELSKACLSCNVIAVLKGHTRELAGSFIQT